MRETKLPVVNAPMYGLTFLVHPNYRSPLAFQFEFGLSGKQEYSGNHVWDEYFGPNRFFQTTSMTTDLGVGFGRAGVRMTGRSNGINPFIAFGLEGISTGSGSATYDLTINSQTETGKKEEIRAAGGGGIWASVGFKKDLGRHTMLSFDTSISISSEVALVLPKVTILFGG